MVVSFCVVQNEVDVALSWVENMGHTRSRHGHTLNSAKSRYSCRSSLLSIMSQHIGFLMMS